MLLLLVVALVAVVVALVKSFDASVVVVVVDDDDAFLLPPGYKMLLVKMMMRRMILTRFLHLHFALVSAASFRIDDVDDDTFCVLHPLDTVDSMILARTALFSLLFRLIVSFRTGCGELLCK